MTTPNYSDDSGQGYTVVAGEGCPIVPKVKGDRHFLDFSFACSIKQRFPVILWFFLFLFQSKTHLSAVYSYIQVSWFFKSRVVNYKEMGYGASCCRAIRT